MSLLHFNLENMAFLLGHVFYFHFYVQSRVEGWNIFFYKVHFSYFSSLKGGRLANGRNHVKNLKKVCSIHIVRQAIT